MGCAASCTEPDMPSAWYTGDSPESLRWQSEETGFGIGRNRPYIDSFQKVGYNNRRGNEHGELAGHLLVYNHLGSKPNYAAISPRPHFQFVPGTKIFAKAFLGCPLGRMPIGENTLCRASVKGDPVTKHGPVLVGMCPRIISMFVDVDGVPAKFETFESSGLTELALFYKDRDVKPTIPKGGIQGAFFSYVVSRGQDEFFFLHFPLISKFADCHSVDTGGYGAELTRNFIRLFSSLRPGHHKVDIRIKCLYDHCDLNYFPLNRNVNARGLWYTDLFNSRLKYPHPNPQRLVAMAYPIAEGGFTIEVPAQFANISRSLLDIRAPPEKYSEADAEAVRKEARIVASSHCRENYDEPEGFPDVVILTSEKHVRVMRDMDLGYKYKYEYVEIAGLWLSVHDRTPDGFGVMIVGCMAKGEIKPKEVVNAWTWTQPMRAGKPIHTSKIPIMNKYIKEAIEKEKKKVPPPPRKK